MVEQPFDDLPTLRRLAEQHGLAEDELEALLERHELMPRAAEDLLHLATVEFRSLSRWGQKAEFTREVERVVNAYARSPRAP